MTAVVVNYDNPHGTPGLDMQWNGILKRPTTSYKLIEITNGRIKFSFLKFSLDSRKLLHIGNLSISCETYFFQKSGMFLQESDT
jgi:hypothetical protein